MGIQSERTHRMTIFSPGDCWGGDPEGIAAQSERLLQSDSEVQRLPIILDLWGNCNSAKKIKERFVLGLIILSLQHMQKM